MTYFPVIQHINDVLPFIKDKREIVIKKTESYTVIDYVYTTDTTFDNDMALECRGLKFDPSGYLICRPFHKFFNVGERQALDVDFSEPHVVMEKMDGSMIAPCIIDGHLRFTTRFGTTDVSRLAEKLLTDDLAYGCESLIINGYTPIFEFTSPAKRIVIKYNRASLTLLALRHMHTGMYVNDLEPASSLLGIPAVKLYDPLKPMQWNEIVELSKSIQDIEGYVIRFNNGRMVKIKGTDYVLKHATKENINREKNILKIIVKNQLDDVLQLLSKEEHRYIQNYADSVLKNLMEYGSYIDQLCERGKDLDQKQFAVDLLKNEDSTTKSGAFAVRGGLYPNGFEFIKDFVYKKSDSQSGVDSVRHIIGTVYDAVSFGEI